MSPGAGADRQASSQRWRTSSDSGNHPKKTDWLQNREVIERLYVEEGLPLKDVMMEMEQCYKFYAT